MIGEIITEHRERMLNLKKYYPFFKLIDTSFSQFKEGRYEALDMGYIVMAVLRFFIEENNFKEKEVTYKEYQEFFNNIIRHDFDMKLTEEESREVADYVFDKMKNEGKPFEYAYYDPVEKKKRVSRVKLIESTIKDNTVWYSISADAVEFYLDTKEIKDESRISVSQLLLEKMINSNNFKGGVEVIERINEEVGRLKVKKNEVMDMLSKDVKTGLEHYEDFVNTGMKWFVDEEKLFKKNKELIDKAIERLESNSSATESYYRTLKEIHYLEDQLKIAMNKHAELLRDCTDMQNKTDEAVKKAKLSRLRPHMDFTATLSDMIRTDDASLLAFIIEPLLKLNIKKTFDIKTIDEALLVKPARYDKKEYVTEDTSEDIVYEDEIEDERIRHNYIFIMNNLKECINRKCMNKSDILTLGEFNNIMSEAYGEEILNNADYYSFFVNLCQKDSYVIGGDNMQSETFLDEILKEGFEGSEPVHIIMEKGTDEIIDYTNVQEPAGDIHRGVHRPQQRAVVLVRHLHQLRRRLHIPRHDHCRERIAHQLVEHTQTLCLGHALQIAYLAPAQYLQALVVKIIVKAYQLQGGPIHVGNGDHRAVIVAAAVQYFHAEGLHHFFQAGGCAFHFFHGRSSCPETGEYTSFNYILRRAFSQHFPHAKKIRFFVK